jgi:hypothetical protein
VRRTPLVLRAVVFLRLLVFRAPVLRRAVVLRAAVLRDAVLRRAVVFRDAVLRRAVVFRDAVLRRAAVLRDAVLRRAVVFRDAVLRRAVVLRDAVFRRVPAVLRLRVLDFLRALVLRPLVLRELVLRELVFLELVFLRVPLAFRVDERRVELLREPLLRFLVPISSSSTPVSTSNMQFLLVRYPFDQLAGLRILALMGDIGLRQDSDQAAVFLHDGQAADLMLCHQPQRLVEVLLRIDRHEIG